MRREPAPDCTTGCGPSSRSRTTPELGRLAAHALGRLRARCCATRGGRATRSTRGDRALQRAAGAGVRRRRTCARCCSSTRPTTPGCGGSCRRRSRPAGSSNSATTSARSPTSCSPTSSPAQPFDVMADAGVSAAGHRHLRAAGRAGRGPASVRRLVVRRDPTARRRHRRGDDAAGRRRRHVLHQLLQHACSRRGAPSRRTISSAGCSRSRRRATS